VNLRAFLRFFERCGNPVMTTKNIIIIALLFAGFHLLLFGYLKRRIAAAKALALEEEATDHD
jgi:hypothetical protein